MTTFPKFKVGDYVHCIRKETDSWWGFDFTGIIELVNIVDDGEIEYKVSNAPILFFGSPVLIWEEEMEKI